MSELNDMNDRRGSFRLQLLASVSGAALLVFAHGARAADDDNDRPTIWVELGGQLEGVDGSDERYTPPFVLATPRPGPETVSPLSLERNPKYSDGFQGKISFQPEDSQWVFSAAVRYSRSNGGKHLHQASYPTAARYSAIATFAKPIAAQSIDTSVQYHGTDAVLDFQAGRDVGLGMFGNGSTSVFGGGVRFAQFNSKANTALKSDPDWHVRTLYINTKYPHFPFGQAFHTFHGTAQASRSFHGIGPSLSWNASKPILGSNQTAKVALDWGLNAAILFGNQKAVTHHQTAAIYHPFSYFHKPGYQVYQTSAVHQRSKTITVPNFGGFVGASLQFPNAKISLGYRGDFFFGAMDGGIDSRKTENRGFYGPFATISIGLGG